MNIKKYFTISLGVATLMATQISCVHDDNWDAPEITCTNKFDAATKTMAQVVALAPASGSYKIPANGEDIIFDAYVVSSDEQGNFYKSISFQDKPENPTVGLQIEINKSMNYADFPVGSHIRIKANGLVIAKDAGVIKLGAVDPNYAIGRIPQTILGRYMSGVCDGKGIEIATLVPQEVTISQLIASDKFINTLVKVKNVQFDDSVIGKTLMDKNADGTFADTDRKIVDANNPSISTVVRTDGFFKESTYVIPNKSGNITLVASKYNSAYQNIIRSTNDFEFTTDLPSKKLLVEGFDNFTNNDWTTYNAAGAQFWTITTFGNPRPSAYMSGLGSVNEDWLISKSISLSNLAEYNKSITLSFETDGRYSGNALEAYITTDEYKNGDDPRNLNWVKLSAIFDTDMNAFAGFVSSGNIDLKSYENKNIRIAFKYTNSSASIASAWEVDNVKVIATK